MYVILFLKVEENNRKKGETAMTKIETIKALEKKYHVHIDRDFFYGPYYSDVQHESFKIYSADGCCWDKVIGYRSLVRSLADGKKGLEELANAHKVKIVCDNKVLAEIPEIDADAYLRENDLEWLYKTDDGVLEVEPKW